MTFLSHSYIPSGWIPLTFTAWGTASTEQVSSPCRGSAAARRHLDLRLGRQIVFVSSGLPVYLIHRLSNNPILNPRDAGREGLVVSIDGKALFLGIQVLLNAVGILIGPFIGLAISHKIIVG